MKTDYSKAVLDSLRQWKPVLAEFLGTMMLVFFGCMSCIPIDGLNLPMVYLYASLGFGFAVMSCIQTFGHISGALLNPTIAIAAVIFGKIPVMLGLLYIIAECAGAIAGYGLLVALAPVDVAAEGICVTEPNNITDLQALGVEMMLSALLLFVVCSVLDPVNAHHTESISVKFGFAIAGLAIAGSPLTGGGINPARSLAPAVWTNKWEAHWVYWVGPLVGGLVPTVLYKYVWLQKPKEDLKALS